VLRRQQPIPGLSHGPGARIGDRLPLMAMSGDQTDFWVVIAASAPVIALAGLVSMPDAAVAGDILKRARDAGEAVAQKIWLQRLGPQSFWVIIYSMATLVTQSFALIVALLALLQGSTPIPGISIIVAEGIGLLMLLLATLLAGQVGAQRQRVEDNRKAGHSS
jgi:hypothetical protein